MQVVSQGLSFLNNPNQTYRIVSHADREFCLDYSQAKLIINKLSHSKTQIWRVLNDNHGNYGFMNIQNGTFLQIPFQAKGKEGTQCIVSEPNGGNNQKWRIIPFGKSYAIKSCLNLEFGLDIFEQRIEGGNKVIVWSFQNNKDNQLWEFIPV